MVSVGVGRKDQYFNKPLALDDAEALSNRSHQITSGLIEPNHSGAALKYAKVR